MNELIQELQNLTGVKGPQVQRALGVLMGYLLDTVEKPTEGKLTRALPDLSQLGSEHRSQGGFFGAFAGGTAGLLQLGPKLQGLGFGKTELKAAVPAVLGYLKEHVDEDLWEEVKSQLPAALFG